MVPSNECIIIPQIAKPKSLLQRWSHHADPTAGKKKPCATAVWSPPWSHVLGCEDQKEMLPAGIIEEGEGGKASRWDYSATKYTEVHSCMQKIFLLQQLYKYECVSVCVCVLGLVTTTNSCPTKRGGRKKIKFSSKPESCWKIQLFFFNFSTDTVQW